MLDKNRSSPTELAFRIKSSHTSHKWIMGGADAGNSLVAARRGGDLWSDGVFGGGAHARDRRADGPGRAARAGGRYGGARCAADSAGGNRRRAGRYLEPDPAD